MVSSRQYLGLLEKWLPFANSFIYKVTERPELEYFGTGYNNWAVQAHQKAFSAFAVCFADPELDENVCSMKKKEILEHALKMLRFNLESHIEGNYHCLDGTKWGHTWMSVLGMERMMHGIDAIKDYLTDYDWKLLKKVMVSESEWLVDEYYRDTPDRKGEILAGKTIHNHPESNIWNGAHLLRTVLMFPDVKRKSEYIEKATFFIINGISIASDAKCKKIVNGKPVSYWYRGDNFFSSFALNHHGYLNVGYMVICLSNIAMLHFAYKKRGLKAPDFIYRHIEKLWKLIKSCTFPDGRLCRIGGDTRIRYCYCQDYTVPVWLLIRDVLKDHDCEKFEQSWLKIVAKEMATNKDGSFLSVRCKDLSDNAPIYYTRLETDRACTLSMGAYWSRIFSNLRKRKTEKIYQLKQPWHDRYHGSCLVHGKNRIASWCFLSAQPPQGLCVPVKRSDIAEWRNNLAGFVSGYGRINYQTPVFHREFLFENGFAVCGETEVHSEQFISEGQFPEVLAKNTIIFVALPDDATCIVMQKCIAMLPLTYIKRAKGLFLNIPNDIFNDCCRNYWFEDGLRKICGPSKKPEKIVLNSHWLNIDDYLGIIGIYGSNHFLIYRPSKRQAGLKLNELEAESLGTGLFVDELCYPYFEKSAFEKGKDIFDICCVLLAGKNHKQTQLFSKKNIFMPQVVSNSDVRVVVIKGSDSKSYLLAVNFDKKKAEARLRLHGYKRARSFITGNIYSVASIVMSLSQKGIEFLRLE
ncbi:MAG: hypothetical protein N2115_05860 [bacterium]|nr:hypothetical protein [bacterium]